MTETAQEYKNTGYIEQWTTKETPGRHNKNKSHQVTNSINDFFQGSTALVGLGLLHEVPRSRVARHVTPGRTPLGEGIGPSQKPLPDNIQNSQQKDIHAPGEVRTRNPSKQAAVDPRLRSRSHWDWPNDDIRVV